MPLEGELSQPDTMSTANQSNHYWLATVTALVCRRYTTSGGRFFLIFHAEEKHTLSSIEIHLILNHVPIIGMAFISLYLFIALCFRQLFMQKVSLWLLVGLAVLTVAVYLSGLGAEEPAKAVPGVSIAYLQLHEKVARLATLTVCFIGGITLLGLVLLRKRVRLFTYFARGIFAMTLLGTALFILTGYLGGQITHTEIRSSLAQGLSTRTITLGIIAMMTVIVIAMIVPVLLHRDQLFKKAEHEPAEGAAQLPDQHQQTGQELWDEQVGAAAINPPFRRAGQPGSARSLLSYATVTATGQSTSQPLNLSGSAFIQQQPGAWNSLPGNASEQEYRPLTDENTRPLTRVSPKPERVKRKKVLILALCVVGAVIILGSLGLSVLHLLLKPSLPVQVVADIPLTGNPNRFDYQYLDQKSGLLYITHSASNMVTIFDTTSRRIVADVAGIQDPHDVAVASELGRVFVTSATGNLVAVIDEHTHTIVARIPVGEAPDGLIYDPDDQKLFVADEAGQNDAVIDAASERRITEIHLGGDAGDVEYDALSHRILSVVETLNQLVTIDPVTDRIVSRTTLAGCQGAQDLLLDEGQRVAFVDCADNATVVMLDLQSMQILSTQSTGKSPDLMALDGGWHYLYIAGESGVVSVYDEHGRTLRALDEGYVAPGAHTVAVNQETHDMYLPLQNVNGKPILRIALFHAT